MLGTSYATPRDANTLVAKYRDQNRIYLSWDAASWHASKAFIKRVGEINAQPNQTGVTNTASWHRSPVEPPF